MMKSMSFLGMPKALEMGLAVLSQLGEEIPSDLSNESLDQ